MGERLTPKIDRREVLHVFALGASTAAMGTYAPAMADEFPDKAKARYQPNSPEIQTFYRVNRYPPK